MSPAIGKTFFGMSYQSASPKTNTMHGIEDEILNNYLKPKTNAMNTKDILKNRVSKGTFGSQKLQ